MKLVLNNNIGVCPVCGEHMEHSDDEKDGGKYFDHYVCRDCNVYVTYISPDDGRDEYHEYHDGEIRIELSKAW